MAWCVAPLPEEALLPRCSMAGSSSLLYRSRGTGVVAGLQAAGCRLAAHLWQPPLLTGE